MRLESVPINIYVVLHRNSTILFQNFRLVDYKLEDNFNTPIHTDGQYESQKKDQLIKITFESMTTTCAIEIDDIIKHVS